MRVTLGEKVVEPHLGSPILIGQRDSCLMNTPLAGALPSHNQTVVIQRCEIGDAQ